MNSRLLIASLVIAAVVGAWGQCARTDAQEQHRATVRAQDIPRSVQILGSLGQPLGRLVTIRGHWVRPGIKAKDRTLEFVVGLVNGEKPAESIVLHGLQIDSILSHHDRGSKSAPPWDWRFDKKGTEPSPEPVEGETWEMMGVETGHFQDYSPEVWQEIGGPTNQTPPFQRGLYTRFHFIAMKRGPADSWPKEGPQATTSSRN